MPKLMKLKIEDLLLVNVLSVALILAVVGVPDSPLRMVLGLPFVLFFPGYTLTCAIFPCKRDLDGIEKAAMISTVTTTTVIAVAMLASGAALGALATLPLIALLITKEVVTADARRIFTALGRSLDVGILPLLITFALIMALKVLEVIV